MAPSTSTSPRREVSLRSSDRAKLEARRRYLYLRLEDGYKQIEQSLAEGQQVQRWEDFWMTLLDEYERISDRLSELEAA